MLFEDQKTEELQPFIPSKREDDRSHQPTILLELKRKLIHCSILLHVSLIAFYTITSLIIINAQSQMPSKVLPELYIRYEPKLYTRFNESPFSGKPSAEIDRAWHDLMGNMSIRASKEELERLGQKSVDLPSGGQLVWLAVFHDLHCVKVLRQWIYRDHYHPNLTEHEKDHWEVHADHCLDRLRSAAMCHADSSALTTFKWDKGEKPMLSSHRPPHSCVDWDALVASMKGRIVSREEVASMENPRRVGP